MTDIETMTKTAKFIYTQKIKNVILEDLKNLDLIQGSVGNCAVPTAMLILSSLDLIGFMISTEKKQNNSEDNIRAALRYKGFFPAEIYNENCIEALALNYRHSMMHGFFPKKKKKREIIGILKSEESNLWVTDMNNVMSLNVRIFSDDFKSFCRDLEDAISKSNDEDLISNIYNTNQNFYLEASETMFNDIHLYSTQCNTTSSMVNHK